MDDELELKLKKAISVERRVNRIQESRRNASPSGIKFTFESKDCLPSLLSGPEVEDNPNLLQTEVEDMNPPDLTLETSERKASLFKQDLSIITEDIALNDSFFKQSFVNDVYANFKSSLPPHATGPECIQIKRNRSDADTPLRKLTLLNLSPDSKILECNDRHSDFKLPLYQRGKSLARAQNKMYKRDQCFSVAPICEKDKPDSFNAKPNDEDKSIGGSNIFNLDGSNFDLDPDGLGIMSFLEEDIENKKIEVISTPMNNAKSQPKRKEGVKMKGKGKGKKTLNKETPRKEGKGIKKLINQADKKFLEQMLEQKSEKIVVINYCVLY